LAKQLCETGVRSYERAIAKVITAWVHASQLAPIGFLIQHNNFVKHWIHQKYPLSFRTNPYEKSQNIPKPL